MAVALIPLDVITTARQTTTIVIEQHLHINRRFKHLKAKIHPHRVSLLDLQKKALIPPAMSVPEAELTTSHQVAGKTTTVADEIR
jgi:hypothetical protein